MPVFKQINKPLEDLARRLKLFAEILARGATTAAAAREAGYSKKVAASAAYGWIRKTREDSEYPALFDYYEQLRKEKLRLFEVEADTIVNELKLVAFSSIENYLDLPSKRVRKKIDKIEEELRESDAELEGYLRIIHAYERQNARKIGNKIRPGTEPGDDEDRITVAQYNEAYEEATPLRKKITKLRADIRKIKNSPGYCLRLKYIEDIPKELLPAVAEIRETREGIAVKLHSKMDALDKLARWQRMYTDNSGEDESPAKITEMNINVKGSKSTLKVA